MDRSIFLLAIFFIVLPILEVMLLASIAKYTNSILTPVLFVIITGIVGAWLIRIQGTAAYRRIQEELRSGRMPNESLLDGAMILVGGILLITPGVLTDLIGIALLFPPTRSLVRRGLIAWFRSNFKVETVVFGPGGTPPTSGDVVEGTATPSKSQKDDESVPPAFPPN
jgi:UPF0716 protein FxsA